jgi:hypothetical protein
MNLCLILKNQLEGNLVNAANLQYELANNNNLTPQQRQALQGQLSQCQNAASALQPQYRAQKNICIGLKGLTLCQNQIQNLQNQIGMLMKPYQNIPGASTL